MILGAISAALLLLISAGVATAEPAAIERQQAEVAALQAELDRINVAVSEAAEAHNGAVYELGLAKERIAKNSRQLARAKRELKRTQAILERRLVQMYTAKESSLAEILVTSGSISEMADRVDLIQRLGAHDASVVSGLRSSRARLAELRTELVEDRAQAAEQLKRRAAERTRIEALLAERRALLSNANAKLERLLAQERERQRREAEAQAAQARQRAAAQAAQERSARRESPGASRRTTPEAESSTAGGSGASPAEPPAASSPGPVASSPERRSAPSLPSGAGNARAASIAMQYLGVPYRWGGGDPSGFDCSGLASYAYRQIGKTVPHYTVAIYNQFPKVPAGSLQPGDLVFWRGLGHMGIYIGGGQYVHAPQTGDVVKVSPMSSRSDYVGAVRP
jgi:peptidoglycan DL-endopeptidase CwlO